MRQYIFPGILGFVSSLPFFLVGSTLQAWGTVGGLSLMALGALTLVGQPYAYKFLWAPLLDRYKIPFLQGHRRSWMLLMMFLLVIIFYFLSLTQLPHQITWFVSWSVAAAVCSATLDSSIDAFRTEQLPQKDYGIGNASYVSAYRLGGLVAGGIALIIADKIGWKLTYQIMAGIIFLGFLITFFVKEKETGAARVKSNTTGNWLESLWAPLKDLFSQKMFIGMIIFVVLYKFGEAMGVALTTTFLLRGLHFSLTVLGTAYKTVAILTTILGTFLGGYLYKRYSLYATLMGFGICQALGVLFFVWLAIVGKNLPVMITCIAVENFTTGMATTVFLSFLMKLCRQPYTATHYALLSACASLGRIFTGPLASWIVKMTSWETYFIISFFSCIPALVLLYFLRKIFNKL
ncbi:MAG: muropeptide transporter AmpG [Gammaproteobacteria bacterium]|jgi:PAT family beta-lactamase induction signal transducer AmpG|nr:muropeptide transporter AmpG [Gammaproteobacteria bacterium]